MNWFEKIKRYFEKELWTEEMIANAVGKGKITAEQYAEITGQTYTA
ncbi:XkdX family protein [Anaerotruncus sp. DFI.9.16]|nr:XkdX family protein [Anaerotruncus sp. DFI.9.16]MCQ4895573.1 XkdX family protein [Anaerotruncus sp. DFI.9.16]